MSENESAITGPPTSLVDLTDAQILMAEDNRVKVEAVVDELIALVREHRRDAERCDGYFCLGRAATQVFEHYEGQWQFLAHDLLNRAVNNQGPQLGLATTAQLLAELSARGRTQITLGRPVAGRWLQWIEQELTIHLPAEVLAYRTVDPE